MRRLRREGKEERLSTKRFVVGTWPAALVIAASHGACRAPANTPDASDSASMCTSTNTPAKALAESGIARVKEQRFEEAERCFLLAKQIDPSVQQWTNLGSLYFDWSHALFEDGGVEDSKRRRRQSVEAFEAALLVPDARPPAKVHIVLAESYDDLGERAKVILHLERLLRRPDADAADRKKAHEMLDLFVRDPVPSFSPEERARQEEAYQTASSLIRPFMIVADKPAKPIVRHDIDKGRKLLDGVVARDPRNWAAHWMIGKASEALGDHAAAYEAFHRAGVIHPSHPDVAREEVQALLFLGRGADAVVVAKRSREFNPEDPGLLANLAVAQLIAGDVSSAEKHANDALAASPNDEVTKKLVAFIAEVKAGKQPRPQKLPITALR